LALFQDVISKVEMSVGEAPKCSFIVNLRPTDLN